MMKFVLLTSAPFFQKKSKVPQASRIVAERTCDSKSVSAASWHTRAERQGGAFKILVAQPRLPDAKYLVELRETEQGTLHRCTA